MQDKWILNVTSKLGHPNVFEFEAFDKINLSLDFSSSKRRTLMECIFYTAERRTENWQKSKTSTENLGMTVKNIHVKHAWKNSQEVT